MAQYFPSKYPKGRQCDKQYMYNVWNSIHPEDVKQVVDHANNQRYEINTERQKEEAVIISDKWMQELDVMPFVSKTKGRMTQLLKQKSKINAIPKERVTYPVYDFQKKPRLVDPNAPKQNAPG